MPATLRRNGWRLPQFVFAAVFTGAGVWATVDSWRDMVLRAFRDEECSHALLVPLLALWLFWVRRGRIRHCRQTSTWIGPVLAISGAGLYWFGDIYMIELFWHAGAVIVAVGGLLTILGGDILKNFLPVFLSLIFLLPIPGRVRQRISIPLQTATARTTAQVCELIGIDAERSGNLLRINHVDVEVGEACNGMRMTFALVMVSFAFAMTTPLRAYVRFAIIALSPVSAIVCNVIRLIPTVWVYGHCSQKMAEHFHDVSGWVMLFVSFLLLMSIIRLLRWVTIPVTTFTLARA